ncbi:MAG: c-type cytochrome [Porticoccaceae bacterium]
MSLHTIYLHTVHLLTKHAGFSLGLLLSVNLLSINLLSVNAVAGDIPPSLTFDVQPVFDTYCVQCHMLEVAQAGLVLENGEAYANLVGVKSTQSDLLRVSPGNSVASYLANKLLGTHAEAGGSGSGMPLTEMGHRPLKDQDLKVIIDWINQGGQDN